MTSATAPVAIDIIRLLDRLDPQLDQPCTVAGCVHHAHRHAVPMAMAA